MTFTRLHYRKMIRLLLFLYALALSLAIQGPFESDETIQHLNSVQHLWKAGRNFPKSATEDSIKRYLGNKQRRGKSILPTKERIQIQDIPTFFDARTQWQMCEGIGSIRDQGNCGSCWAVSAASVLTDRLCIATNGTFKGYLSSSEVLSCCTDCGDGCDGGFNDQAWKYFLEHGIVTGGEYHSQNGCQPYRIKPCEHGSATGPRPRCSGPGPVTPKCRRYCTNKKYKKTFNKDHHKTTSSYVVPSDVSQIQMEIMANGPVQAGFTVFRDFLSYKSGVYYHISGPCDGGHSVKIIGWGVENNTDYWLVANSWNSDWGDNGFFKIKRGVDECGFESEVSGGIPDISAYQ